MAELTLQQIIIQISNVDEKRSIAQYGEGFLPDEQIFTYYDSLTEENKRIWDTFVAMITSPK